MDEERDKGPEPAGRKQERARPEPAERTGREETEEKNPVEDEFDPKPDLRGA